MLTGYKTYIVTFLGVLVTIAMALGYLNSDFGFMVLGILGFGSVAALRSAVKTEVLALIKSAKLPMPAATTQQ